MFRKAALALALMASLFVAEAMDLPKPARELHNGSNKTKSTKPNSGVKSKTKSAQLCLLELLDDTTADADAVNLYSGFYVVYDCADVEADGSPKANADSIGKMGVLCSYPDTAEAGTCTSELTLETAWHKTVKQSSLAASFWFDVTTFTTDATEGRLTMIAPVVTGTTGAFGKTDAITSLALTHIADDMAYRLTINYKGRGWNPAAY